MGGVKHLVASLPGHPFLRRKRLVCGEGWRGRTNGVRARYRLTRHLAPLSMSAALGSLFAFDNSLGKLKVGWRGCASFRTCY